MSRKKHKLASSKPGLAGSDAGGPKHLRSNAGATVSTTASIPDNGAPFGTLPRRGRGPLIAWSLAYAAWLGMLLYMAAYTVGLK